MMPAAKRRATTRRKAQKPSKKEAEFDFSGGWTNEIVAVLFAALAVFLLVSFLWSDPIRASAFRTVGGTTPFGPVGHFIGTIMAGFMGWCALVPVAWAAFLSVFFWNYDEKSAPKLTPSRMYFFAGLLGMLVFSCTLGFVFWGRVGGGSVGGLIARPLIHYLNRTGASLVAGSFFLIALALATRQSIGAIVRAAFYALTTVLYFLVFTIPGVVLTLAEKFIVLMSRYISAALGDIFPLEPEKTSRKRREDVLVRPRLRKNAMESIVDEAAGDKQAQSAKFEEEHDYSHVVVTRRESGRLSNQIEVSKTRTKKAEAPALESLPESDASFSDYEPPALDLLTPGERSASGENDEELREKSKLIEVKLKDFGILGKVTQVHPGPVITLFEFEPAPGVKVGKIAALQDDMAMSLRASSIRIIAPIPKRGTVGIEVPNKHRDIVRLRDVLESEEFLKADATLFAPLGKDTYGDPVVVDITTMPHLLMAGATGTGKSVCINALLLGLLYRARPEDLGLILIDPKILELSVYEGIPHLRVPVVTHPRQAKAVLQWAINEMNRRYRLMQRFEVRGIDAYNRIVRGQEEVDPSVKQNLSAPSPQSKIIRLTEDEVVESGTVEREENDPVEPLLTEKLEPLPKIVIVIDELADLMLSVGHDIEELITRLAQKARASGIHLIIATQRPSVDVITGLIKANFPARLSFRVSSRIDSRTILDSMGADKLLGRGDMLFMQPGAETLRRVHGAFVSDAEVKKVVSFLKDKCSPHYDTKIMEICEKALEEEESEKGEVQFGEDEYDEMYDHAVELVRAKGFASTSMIQRAFRIGYNRAARIIDMMEKEGVVGPMDGAKPREVLMPQEDKI